jgi:hypothetical protein
MSGRDLEGHSRKKAPGSTSGYSAYDGIGHHIAPPSFIPIPSSHPPPPIHHRHMSEKETHLLDVLLDQFDDVIYRRLTEGCITRCLMLIDRTQDPCGSKGVYVSGSGSEVFAFL